MSDKGGCNQVIASDKTEEEKQRRRGVLGEMEGRGGCRRPSGLREDETVGYQMLLKGEYERRISLTLGNIWESAFSGI